MAVGEGVREAPARRSRSLRPVLFGVTLTAALLLLFGVPWWTLVVAGARWPGGVVAAGTVLFAAGLVAFPVLMFLGHARRMDWAARIADSMLGVIWVTFSWA